MASIREARISRLEKRLSFLKAFNDVLASDTSEFKKVTGLIRKYPLNAAEFKLFGEIDAEREKLKTVTNKLLVSLTGLIDTLKR